MDSVCSSQIVPLDRLNLYCFLFFFYWPPSFQGCGVKGNRPAFVLRGNPCSFHQWLPRSSQSAFLILSLVCQLAQSTQTTPHPLSFASTVSSCGRQLPPLLPTWHCQIQQQPSGHSSGTQCHVRQTEPVLHQCVLFGWKTLPASLSVEARITGCWLRVAASYCRQQEKSNPEIAHFRHPQSNKSSN